LGADTCSGATVSYDQTCTVQVAVRPDGTGPLPAELVLSGGRGRSVEHYKSLAAVAGLTATDVTTTSSGLVVIDCRSS
jgi:hypothetical protein